MGDEVLRLGARTVHGWGDLGLARVRRENIPEAEAGMLRDLESEVLIPLRTKNTVEGFLSLGPKASEAAYSPSDLHLLQSVAHQTALALDNSRLVEQVASEMGRREAG